MNATFGNDPTKRPGARVHAWWASPNRRGITVEIAYLLIEGPLVVSDVARRLAWLLWRKGSGLRRWPTQYQLALALGTSERDVRRKVEELEQARMLRFHRPWNIRDGNTWRGRRQSAGTYELTPPSEWAYAGGWTYLGLRLGWRTPAGEIVGRVSEPFDFPEREPGARTEYR